MKVVIDDKIPFIRSAVERLFEEVVYLPGNTFSPQNIKDADALIIRTRTHCDKALLENTQVKFIATATIGYDHIDTAYLEERGIAWTNCPGCNASSVGQYIESCLILLQKTERIPSFPTIGIVGAGHVGTQVAQKARALGCTVKLNDPPRESREGNSHLFFPLEELEETCDVITFHTPITYEGPFASHHLAGTDFFSRLKRDTVLINTARGGVVDERLLKAAYENGSVSTYIIDTWENEPDIDRELLRNAFIGTPHIAGYSADGKCNASRMALHAVCGFFHLSADFAINPPALPKELTPVKDEKERKLQLYNPLRDSNALKENPEKFEYLRGHYPLRREFFNE